MLAPTDDTGIAPIHKAQGGHGHRSNVMAKWTTNFGQHVVGKLLVVE
jgi:hypothetical protein